MHVRTARFLAYPSPVVCTAMAALLLLPFAGCKKTLDDSTLNANVRDALANDPAIVKQSIQTTTLNGVVTLVGNVTDPTASSVAAQDAAKVAGVKEVVNNIQVAGLQVAPTVTTPDAPTSARPATQEERKVIARKESLPPPPAPVSRPAPEPATVKRETPVVPPPPAYRDVTVPAGTSIPVRITETLNSKTTEEGASFNGTVARDVVAGGVVVIPSGSAVSGRVTDAKDAGHFKGHSALTIELTSVRRRGVLTSLSTDPYTVEGKNRGKNSAIKIGGGAAAGALLGGLLGGGKGAAIGSLAGGGGGAAYQGLTRGDEVSIPSETEIRFRLASSISVRTSETSSSTSSSGLQSR